jgi:hypothetical protein
MRYLEIPLVPIRADSDMTATLEKAIFDFNTFSHSLFSTTYLHHTINLDGTNGTV